MMEFAASQRNLFEYLKFLKNKKLHLFIAIISGVIYGLSSGFGIPIVLKYSSSYLFNQKEVSSMLLIFLTLLPIFIMLIRGVSGFLSSYYLAACGQHVVENLRIMIFKKIQKLHIGFFNNYPPAELISSSINATTIIQTNLVEISNAIIAQPMVLIGATGYLAFLCVQQHNLVILLLFLLALPVFIFPIRKIGKRLRKKSSKMHEHTSDIIDKLNHNLSAIKEIRAFCLEKQETNRYISACHNFTNAFLNVVKYQLIISPLIEILSAGGVGFAMFYAYKNGLKLEIFMSLATSLYFGYDAIKKLGDVSSKIQSSMAAVDRIEAILVEQEKILDPKNPVSFGVCQGNITFNDVDFEYDKNENVLKNINVTMLAGKKYALVGSSGAGKSTFVNLILRFYDLESGIISIDGIDIKNITQYDLRQSISYVPQDPALINDTIFNNIAWGKLDATPDGVIDAAKKSYAHDFISKLPNGYNTVVGESGNCMSGGQRQRIALARVFLKKSKILIFDEATSALDSESQQAIFNAVENISRDRTVIVVSHRFSMMSMIDEILVFSHGEIIERGHHNELIMKDTVYKKLYDKQHINNKIK